ncbi:MAG: endolytic transglycosylase MltG [Anaerolineales bacterium]
MPKRRRSCRSALIAMLLVGLCLAAGVGVAAGALPDAVGRLGPVSPSLRPPERAYLTASLLLRSRELDQPANPALGDLQIEVPMGASATDAVDQLHQAGLVDNSRLMVDYLRYRGLDRGIEAGLLYLSGRMTLREIALALQSASPNETMLTIPEGWRAAQIAFELSTIHSTIGPEAFMEAADGRPTNYAFSDQLPSEGGLEGFLFPDTYRLDPNMTAIELVISLLDNFERKVTPEMRHGFEEQGLTTYQAVTLASIVEREAVIAEERPQIASVFLNRMALGMKLDADPTIQYALGLQPDGSWWKHPLTAADLELQSPYNTYQQPGLPPTPISNPGLLSLQAVAEPDQTSFLFFRAACDGSGRHRFAVTFEEHVSNACE